MEENKVVMKLQEYIELIKELDSLKKKLEDKDKNYIGMINYIKNEIKDSENYHIINFEKNIDEKFVNKINDYHYKNILDEFIAKGITFDTALQLTDELIIEYRLEKGEQRQ